MESDSENSHNSPQPTKSRFEISNIPLKYWALLVMVVWGGGLLLLGLLRLDTFAINEGGALSLLLAWSISDKIINPVAILGGPDFRALFFWPIALYWPGSMLAAKIATMAVMFWAIFAMYIWRRQKSGEVALIASGLLLISPLTILLIDTINVAPFLFGAFALGMWLDKKYRASPHSISSLYFLQMLLVAATVTLHPIGLAYPLALAWQWQNNPKTEKQKKQVWLGLGISVSVILATQLGWLELQWLSNPLISLSHAFLSYDELDPSMGNFTIGIVLAALLAGIVLTSYKDMLQDSMGSMLLIALAIGLFVADHNWALIALAVILYCGTPKLIALNTKLGKHGFAGNRGLVMAGIIIVATLFMLSAKSHALFIKSEILAATDELIRTLCQEARDPDTKFIAASQWPARTMLECQRDVFPLPPAQIDGITLLDKIEGITHVIFNPKVETNKPLANNFAEIAGSAQTLAIQRGGIIIKVIQKEEQENTLPAKAPDANIQNPK